MSIHRKNIGIISSVICSLMSSLVHAEVQVSDFTAGTFIESGDTMRYRLFIPDTLHSQRYPLVVAMHGYSQRGNDNTMQLTASRMAMVWAEDSNQIKFPCFVLAPQCPKSKLWIGSGLTLAEHLMDSVIQLYPIDTNRLYLTGISMGASAVWTMLTHAPKRYAAAIPVAGVPNLSTVKTIFKIPVWAFIGALDDQVSVLDMRTYIDSMRHAGGNPLYTEYADGAHDTATFNKAYAEPDLLPWVFNQHLSLSTDVYSLHQSTTRPAPNPISIKHFSFDKFKVQLTIYHPAKKIMVDMLGHIVTPGLNERTHQ